jgi:hypothetical protein
MDPLPVESAVLNYATPEKRGEFRAHWAIRVMLLAGVAAFFVPLAGPEVAFTEAVEIIREILRSTMYLQRWTIGAIMFGFALAVPLFLLAVVPVHWRILSALVRHGSLVAGSLALAAGGVIALVCLSPSGGPLVGTREAPILIVTLLCGGALTLRALLRRHGLPSVVWLLLSTTYIAIVGFCLAVPEVARVAQIGYWLTLVNLIAVVIQSVRTVRDRW